MRALYGCWKPFNALALQKASFHRALVLAAFRVLVASRSHPAGVLGNARNAAAHSPLACLKKVYTPWVQHFDKTSKRKAIQIFTRIGAAEGSAEVV